MIKSFLKVVLFCLAILVVGNLLFLDFFWFKTKSASSSPSSQPAVVSNNQPLPETKSLQDQICPDSCLTWTKEEIQRAIENLPVSTTTKISPAPSLAQVPKTFFLTIGSFASLTATDWTDVPATDFYFDQSDYPHLKSVRWEVNLRSSAPGNSVSVRIYDVTNNRAVDGSDLVTTSGSNVLVRSSDLSVWQGNNLYRLQVKAAISGSAVMIDTPRLKITTE